MQVTAQRGSVISDPELAENQPAGADEVGRRGPEIVVRGRHVDVTEGLRRHVTSKLTGLERLDHKLFRLDVEISEERNPRMAATCERVEITCYSRGPVVRAEAAAPDVYAALDLACGKLEERLRRAAERRHSRGSRVAKAQAVQARVGAGGRAADGGSVGGGFDGSVPLNGSRPAEIVDGAHSDVSDGPFLVREKEHRALPMTLDDALSSMELVGHDFFLYEDVDAGCASVVYRRRGYHYGVLRLRAGAGSSTDT